jgi:hypothetical protein
MARAEMERFCEVIAAPKVCTTNRHGAPKDPRLQAELAMNTESV